jgi:hypothetical protein
MPPYQVQDGSAHAAAAPPNGAMNSRRFCDQPIGAHE